MSGLLFDSLIESLQLYASSDYSDKTISVNKLMKKFKSLRLIFLT